LWILIMQVMHVMCIIQRARWMRLDQICPWYLINGLQIYSFHFIVLSETEFDHNFIHMSLRVALIHSTLFCLRFFFSFTLEIAYIRLKPNTIFSICVLLQW